MIKIDPPADHIAVALGIIVVIVLAGLAVYAQT